MGKTKGAIVVDTIHCKGCGLCIEACPTQVIDPATDVNGKGFHYAVAKNPEACIGCANCALVCPDSCITVYRVKEPIVK